MAFSKRRGRPRKTYETGKDKGTLELQAKRMQNQTIEPLDLCLSKGIITEQQHNAGIRLRWLYTLKFGAPTISAYLPDESGGHSCKSEDSNWIAKRQNEYNKIIELLDKTKSRKLVMDICVFNNPPAFLYEKPEQLNKYSLTNHKHLMLFVTGLDMINALNKNTS